MDDFSKLLIIGVSIGCFLGCCCTFLFKKLEPSS